MITIKFDGLEEVLKKVGNVQQLKGVKTALRAGALHIKGKIAQYPPSSEANAPGQKRWYQRGYGPKWTRIDGSIGGSKTSQNLRKRWTIGARDGGLTQIVGNNASYAPFVQDKDRQAAFHARRGWNTAQDVAEEEAATVVRFIQEEIDKALRD